MNALQPSHGRFKPASRQSETLSGRLLKAQKYVETFLKPCGTLGTSEELDPVPGLPPGYGKQGLWPIRFNPLELNSLARTTGQAFFVLVPDARGRLEGYRFHSEKKIWL